MADKNGVKISIEAADNTSPALLKLQKALTGLADGGRKAGEAIASSSTSSSLARITSGMGDYSRRVREAVMSTASLVPPLAAIGGFASLAGIGALAQQFGRFGTNLEFTSARAVVTTRRLQQLQNAVQLGGGDRDSVAGGLASLHDAASGALTGLNGDASMAFQYMGISDDELRGPTDALFEKVRTKLAQYQKVNPMLAEMMGSKVLGGGYGGMAPAILRSGPEWQGYEAKAAKIDPGVTDEGAKAADKLRETFDQIDIRVHSIGHTIGAELAPALNDLVGKFDKLLHDNQEEIGKGAREFAEWIRKQDWKGMEEGAEAFAKKADDVVGKLGGWKTAVEVLGAAWVLNSPVGKLTAELASLAAFKFPGWMGRLLGIGAAGGVALESTLLLGGDTPAGTAAPGAISREEAQQRVDQINGQLAGGPGFFTRVWNGIMGAGSGTPSLPKGETDARARKAFAYFVGKGWSPQAAAGIVAGGVQESGLNEAKPGDNGQAYGAFQWWPERQAAFKRMFGHDIHASTFDEQLAFKDAELRGAGGDPQSATAGSMLNVPGVTAGQAGAIDSLYAERPKDATGEARRRHVLAEELYRQYAGSQPTAPGAGTPANDAPVVPTVAPGASSGPAGTARIDVHVHSDGTATATTRQQGDNFMVAPAGPATRMPMSTQQGG